MTLKRATLAEQAYEELRARIVSGALPAGRRLLPEELASELAISPTPVKEAIAQLERDGLVEGSARRASSVRRFSADDVREICAARTLLEEQAVTEGHTAGTITPAFVARIEAIYASQLELAARRQPVVFAEAMLLDRALHETLMELAGNRILADWHRGILAQTQTFLTYASATYDSTRAFREHAAIITALKRRKLEPMITSVRTHLRASRDEILRRLPGIGPDGAIVGQNAA